MGILPTLIAEKDPQLKLLKLDNSVAPLWLVTHPEVSQNARVRTTIDFLVKAFSN